MKIFIYPILFFIFTGILLKGLWGEKKEKKAAAIRKYSMSLKIYEICVEHIFSV